MNKVGRLREHQEPTVGGVADAPARAWGVSTGGVGGSSPPTAAESMEPLLSPSRISAMGAPSRRGWS
jgi:hypothetical protein